MTREEIKKAMRDTKREIVIKNLHKLLSLVEGYPEYEDCVSYAIEELEQEPKTVHKVSSDLLSGHYCPKCMFYVKKYYNYCPNCGEPQESEN